VPFDRKPESESLKGGNCWALNLNLHCTEMAREIYLQVVKAAN